MDTDTLESVNGSAAGASEKPMTITQRLHAAEQQRDEAFKTADRRVAEMQEHVQKLQNANNEALQRLEKNRTVAQLEITMLRSMITRLAHGGLHIESMQQI
jgi:hypothetical protein